ncbi:MAG: pyrroline-5-carboxylate reductase [Peptococcaceae bacterium]|nr:pyrroline-5-carboxylate reductase [Peptococcaceae bacterium]
MSKLTEKKIGFIGAGRMAEAIFSGLLKSGEISAKNLVLTDIAAERLNEMAEKYSVPAVQSAADGQSLPRELLDCDIVLLAIKPQGANALLSAAGKQFAAGQLVVSIMGGITLAFLQERIPRAAVIRVMPNAPMLAGEGVAGVALGEKATEENGETALALFRAVGAAYLCPEHLIDALTGISGCGPAYAYIFMEAMADCGVELGLPRDMAYRLAAQTLVGAGRMALETGRHPGQLKDDVCSPGGSTIAGVHVLEQNGFRGIVMDAVEAGTRRMEEIGRNA